MNKIVTLSLAAVFVSASIVAQTQITNGGFENWGNASPGVSTEPTSWYSNLSGSNIAQLGPQTCFQCTSLVHSGSSCVRVETESYIGTAVNGVVTTGVVDAPSFTKSDGYVGTVNYSTASDDRRMAFTGRPDSIVGWYQYSPGGSGEQGKVRVILHTGDYYDPETPTTNHPNPTANRIADTTFYTPTTTVSSWTRFSLPFNYFSTSNPAYIMINVTSSANQSTTVTGSQMWLDDIAVVYNPSAGINQVTNNQNLKAYYADKTVYVDLQNTTNDESTLSIFDLTGKLMSSQKLESTKLNTLNVSTLNAGMYLYQIVGSAYQKTGKFIIN
jgi:putative glycosyl hydrolase or carbohydrate binding protein/type IX secretion system substrate protein